MARLVVVGCWMDFIVFLTNVFGSLGSRGPPNWGRPRVPQSKESIHSGGSGGRAVPAASSVIKPRWFPRLIARIMATRLLTLLQQPLRVIGLRRFQCRN